VALHAPKGIAPAPSVLKTRFILILIACERFPTNIWPREECKVQTYAGEGLQSHVATGQVTTCNLMRCGPFSAFWNCVVAISGTTEAYSEILGKRYAVPVE